MTQTKLLRKARSLTAAVVGSLFLFSTVATPLVEANFWEQRRDASRRANGQGSQNSTLLASLPNSLGKMDGVLPSVHGSLGNVFQSAPPLELSGTPTPADLRAATLPTWLRGLPSAAGEIREVALAKNAETAPVVVLIQDVHNVFSAQKSIAQILAHIEAAAVKEKRGPVLIGLEGGYRGFDLDRFRAFRDRPGHALVSELLLKTHLISGAEYFAFLADRNPLLWGVETPADYIENVEAVRGSHPAVERVTASLGAAQLAVESKGAAVFSKELKDLNKTLAAQSRGDIPIVDLVRILRERAPKTSAPEVDKLQKALNLESQLDFAKVERERAALIEQLVKSLDAASIERLVSASLSYRSGQISFSAYHNQLKALVKGRGIRWSDYGMFDQYVQYVLLAESIDKFRLFDELEDLKSQAVALAGRTSEEKVVMGLAEDLRLISRLVRHEFGPVEWKAYRTRKDDLGRLQTRLDAVLGTASVQGPSADDVALFERFYRAADRRNDSLIDNLLAKSKETNSKVMALVAGGFHTPELESRLKAKGYSVVTITPQIGEIPQGHSYMDIFLVKHIPIEEYLAGQKLYLSPLLGRSAPMGVANYAVDGNAGDRGYSAGILAVETWRGNSPTAEVAKQFPTVQTSVDQTPDAVTVTAQTPEGSVQITATSDSQGETAPDPQTIASVQNGQTQLAMAPGARGGAQNSLSFNSAINAIRGFFSAVSSLPQKIAVPIAGLVGAGWRISGRALSAMGSFFRGFQGGRSFREILGDWLSPFFGLFKMGIIPEDSPFREHLPSEDFGRLQKELLDMKKPFFDLSSLASSYHVSEGYLSTLLNQWGKEKTLLLPGGGWTSFLIIERPEGAKGKGPFIARFQEIHKQGYSHDAVVVLAVTPDGRLILQHRPDKDQYDVGASGHVDIGETPLQAASHELAEELGIEESSSNFVERLVPIPNPEREGGVFYKEGGRSFSEYIYSESGLDFSGPSKENRNRENVHLFAILLNEDEVHQVEKIGTRTSSGERGGAGFLPLQIVLDVQNRMTTVAALFTKMWFPQISGPMGSTDLEVDRVEMVDQIALSQMIGGNGAAYASSLRHFFQGEKIRSVVTGYLKGLLSAEKLGQQLGQVSLIENRNNKPAYGMTLVMGNPFSNTGILKHVVVSLREGLSFISHQKIKNSWDRAHATVAPLVRSKTTPFTTQDLPTPAELEKVLSAISEADPMTFELGEVSFGDWKDGSVILTLRQVGEKSLQSLREKLSQAGLPFKFQPSATGNRLYVQVGSIGTEAFSKMTSEEIVAVEQWMTLHKDLKKWWDLHRQFAEEKKKNRPGFSDKKWLESQLGLELSNDLVAVWQMEASRLVGRVQIEPQEVFGEIVLADYSRRTLSALMSQGVTLPLGERSEVFPDATSFIEQVAAVQAGVAYHNGKLKTDPIHGRFRPSEKADAPNIRDVAQEETDRIAQIGLDNLNKGIIADLAAGAASRMANDLPEKAITLLKKMQGTGKNDPVRPLSKGAVPIAEVDGEVHTFLGSFLTNVHAFYSRLRSLGYFAEPSILIYSNGQYLHEVESELSKRGNYGLNRTQIDTSLLQKLRPQFGGSVNDVIRMQADGKFKTDQEYLVALEKARKLEQKLSQGKGEASLLVEEKAPHGHGEFLHDFVASGKLLNMIEAGKKWLYVRNVDNVGATVDYNFLVTLGLFIEKGLDFQAEVSPRLPGMKGGALLMTEQGQTILTEGPSFAATWENVENELAEKGFSPLDEKESEGYVQHVFDGGGHLVLNPTQMDFEGHTIDNREQALDAVRNDGVRIYRDREGHTQAVRYIVPESTHWFNNATGLISPHYFYYIYRLDADQTYEQFIDEMRKAYATNQGGLHRIAQRGKDRFPILLDAKPTKSGGVGQKPETNMWQSTQVAGEAGANIGAVGVDSLKMVMEMGKFENMEEFVSFIKNTKDQKLIDDLLAFLRFLATKQWEGKVESYEANFDIYPLLVKMSWDPERLLPSRLSKLRRDSNGITKASKEGGFLNLDVFSEVFRNKWARGFLLGLVLLVISPAAMAAPGVILAGLGGWEMAGLTLGVVGLLAGAIKMVSPDQKTLFEQTGREPLGELLIPRAREQLLDLKSTTRFLGVLTAGDRKDENEVGSLVSQLRDGEFSLYGEANWDRSSRTFGQTGEAVLETLETSRASLVQASEVMAGSAGNLTDAVGALVPSQAQAVYADHAVRATLLAALAAKREAGVALYDNAKSQIMDSLGAFGDVLFGSETSASIHTKLTSLGELADVNPDNIVVVDQVQPGVLNNYHVDETSDRAKILNLVEMLERNSSVGAQKDLSVPGTGLMITLAHGMESGENADLIERLKELGAKATEAGLPINVHQGSAIGDEILNINSDGMVVVNVLAVLKLLNINPNQANLKIQLIASPTSTVVFNTEGLPRTVLVEKIKWLLEGIGLRISSEQTENEIRSLIAALKAA